MFPKKLLILCFICLVHANDRHYEAELASESNNGEVFCFILKGFTEYTVTGLCAA